MNGRYWSSVGEFPAKCCKVLLLWILNYVTLSSGQTRSGSTTTEAESYLRLALSSNFLPTFTPDSHSPQMSPTLSPFPRATSENHALDSFQNLLFSIARFHEYTGRWPEHITVVGYEMKRRRFEELHRVALRWPVGRFTYIGIDAKWEGTAAQEGEVSTQFKTSNAVDHLMIVLFLLCSSKMGTGPTHRTCTAVIQPYSQNAEVGTLFGDFTRIIRPHQTLHHCLIGVQISGPDYLMVRFLGTIWDSHRQVIGPYVCARDIYHGCI